MLKNSLLNALNDMFKIAPSYFQRFCKQSYFQQTKNFLTCQFTNLHDTQVIHI